MQMKRSVVCQCCLFRCYYLLLLLPSRSGAMMDLVSVTCVRGLLPQSDAYEVSCPLTEYLSIRNSYRQMSIRKSAQHSYAPRKGMTRLESNANEGSLVWRKPSLSSTQAVQSQTNIPCCSQHVINFGHNQKIILFFSCFLKKKYIGVGQALQCHFLQG